MTSLTKKSVTCSIAPALRCRCAVVRHDEPIQRRVVDRLEPMKEKEEGLAVDAYLGSQYRRKLVEDLLLVQRRRLRQEELEVAPHAVPDRCDRIGPPNERTHECATPTSPPTDRHPVHTSSHTGLTSAKARARASARTAPCGRSSSGAATAARWPVGAFQRKGVRMRGWAGGMGRAQMQHSTRRSLDARKVRRKLPLACADNLATPGGLMIRLRVLISC
jgi:hypothetical protein